MSKYNSLPELAPIQSNVRRFGSLIYLQQHDASTTKYKSTFLAISNSMREDSRYMVMAITSLRDLFFLQIPPIDAK